MKNINKVFFYFKKIKDSCDDEIESIAKNLKLTKPDVKVNIKMHKKLKIKMYKKFT